MNFSEYTNSYLLKDFLLKNWYFVKSSFDCEDKINLKSYTYTFFNQNELQTIIENIEYKLLNKEFFLLILRKTCLIVQRQS